MKYNKGFTFIELLVVIALVFILSIVLVSLCVKEKNKCEQKGGVYYDDHKFYMLEKRREIE